MANLHWWKLGAVLLIITNISTSALAEDKAPADIVIKMPPYIIQGERALPPPESWRYVLVPAGELTRGKQVVATPGYEVLSNLSVKERITSYLGLAAKDFQTIAPSVKQQRPANHRPHQSKQRPQTSPNPSARPVYRGFHA